jgi:hypothetical protein
MTTSALAAARYDPDDYPYGEEWDMNMKGQVKGLSAGVDFRLVRARNLRGTAAENIPDVAA